METYTKIKYIPLKYKTVTKSISVPKETILNSIGINKYKNPIPKRELSLNSNTMIYQNNNNNYYDLNPLKIKYLNSQYNNIAQQNNINYNFNNDIYSNIYNNNLNTKSATINPFNKTTPSYYTNKLKDKILNNLKDNFQTDKIKKKKALYVNVNFNVNQNYSMPNYGYKNNRSLSVQNNYQNKNKRNDINKNININNKKIIDNTLNLNNINNNYFASYYDTNKNKTIKYIYKNDKQILTMNKNYIYTIPNQNKSINIIHKRNPSYTKILNYKSLEMPIKQYKNINSKSNNKYINTNLSTNINKINNNNKNPKNIINNKNTIITEPNNIKNKLNNKDEDEQINYSLYNLELKMQKLLKENKKESKGINYNIVRKIFEEGINVMNLPQMVKKFLKLIMIKYHDVVYAFSQENKSLRQSNENLQNINFSLDKKYIELDKKYKLILKENKDMKKELTANTKTNIKKINSKIAINEIDDNSVENKKINNNEINNNMYKSIKDMDFIVNGNSQKYEEDKNEKNNEKNEKENSIKNINLIKKINTNKIEIKENKNLNLKDGEDDNNKLKSDNHRRKIDMLNRMNVKDLDSLYFHDKVNNINTQNSQKNYDKVPKIKFHKK